MPRGVYNRSIHRKQAALKVEPVHILRRNRVSETGNANKGGLDRTIPEPIDRPDRPCFKCGSANWCQHRPRPDRNNSVTGLDVFNRRD
jgi:hypothetical protein